MHRSGSTFYLGGSTTYLIWSKTYPNCPNFNRGESNFYLIGPDFTFWGHQLAIGVGQLPIRFSLFFIASIRKFSLGGQTLIETGKSLI